MRLNYLQILFMLVIMMLASVVLAQDWSTSTTPFIGVWQGQWSEPRGYVYEARATFQVTNMRTFKGQINWVLLKSPRPEEQSKLGLTGIEFVRVTYDSISRVLTLEGYDKMDPHYILGLDKYKLIVAENAEVIGGLTYNHGDWQGKFFLTRIK